MNWVLAKCFQHEMWTALQRDLELLNMCIIKMQAYHTTACKVKWCSLIKSLVDYRSKYMFQGSSNYSEYKLTPTSSWKKQRRKKVNPNCVYHLLDTCCIIFDTRLFYWYCDARNLCKSVLEQKWVYGSFFIYMALLIKYKIILLISI